jgi:hypothetical protein
MIKGFDTPRIFYAPKHDNTKDPTYLPDTRTTIFWMPDIILSRQTNIEYYNADNAAYIDIIVEGITGEGIPVSGRSVYPVR